jgi:membrane protein YdbS with pleckstrin-like domain
VTASATEAADAPSETLADGVRRHLDPRWVTVQRIHAAIQVAVVSAVGVITLWITSGSWLAGLLLVLLWMLLSTAVAWQTYRWPPIAYRFASYRVDGDGLEIARGVHWQTITNVPRSRVQHTDVSQGPIERRFGHGTLAGDAARARLHDGAAPAHAAASRWPERCRLSIASTWRRCSSPSPAA